MNLKAERIEQMVQVINRNLLLAFSGQSNMGGLEFKKLQRVEAGVFGHDKFAFEMVHFVKTARDTQFEGTVAQNWEKTFLRGLETLLVECAVVKDDIERDCFVSRVYSWYTGKLAERRTLPKATVQGRLENLKETIRGYGNSEHTLKGLDSYAASADQELARQKIHPEDVYSAYTKQPPVEEREPSVISLPPQTSPRAGSAPAYIRHGFPEILPARTNYNALLPKVPDAEDNYGMIYNKPESDAEKQMHELWMARRRQEAFEWKTQQHMSMVLDRLELQKSRMESDSLRKQESNLHILHSKERREHARSGHARPHSADSASSPSGRSFSPQARRPISGKRRALLEARSAQTRSMRSSFNGRDDDSVDSTSVSPQGERSRPSELITPLPLHNVTRRKSTEDTRMVVTVANGGESETTISRPGRTLVAKPAKRELVPMRFRHTAPEKFINNFEKQQYYMQLSDSDDDDKPDKTIMKEKSSTARGKKSAPKKDAKKEKGPNAFFHPKPIIRERPESAKMFRAVALDDPEFKVHYRYSNFRRMPLTAQQEQWIANKEAARVKKSEELAMKLFEAAQKKGDKKKSGGDKKAGDKAGAKKKTDPKSDDEGAVKPKYRSAEEFMHQHFPHFDQTESFLGGDHEANGPMRTMQLIECAQIAEAFHEHGLTIKDSTLMRALVVPQDRPEAICLEDLRQNGERLMDNPLPMEYWRKAVIKGNSKGGKKKKKKA